MNCQTCNGSGWVSPADSMTGKAKAYYRDVLFPCPADGCHGGVAHCCEGDREQPPNGTTIVRLGLPLPCVGGAFGVVVRP